MIRQSKADQQVGRAMQEADAREAERQFDKDLGESLDRQKAALVKPKLTWWQWFGWGPIGFILFIVLVVLLLTACAAPAPVVTTPAPECRGYRLAVQPDGTHKSVCVRLADQ